MEPNPIITIGPVMFASSRAADGKSVTADPPGGEAGHLPTAADTLATSSHERVNDVCCCVEIVSTIGPVG